jgi:hypothetical protein
MLCAKIEGRCKRQVRLILTMSMQALDDFCAAWQKASSIDSPPTLAMLADCGAQLDHPGFAIIGRCSTPGRRAKPPSGLMFQVLAAGADHEHFGGKIMTGQWLDEIVHPAHLASLIEIYETICREQSLHKWRCMNMIRNAEPYSYTRVLGAIEDDTGDGRCLAGVWVWHDVHAAPTFAS